MWTEREPWWLPGSLFIDGRYSPPTEAVRVRAKRCRDALPCAGIDRRFDRQAAMTGRSSVEPGGPVAAGARTISVARSSCDGGPVRPHIANTTSITRASSALMCSRNTPSAARRWRSQASSGRLSTSVLPLLVLAVEAFLVLAGELADGADAQAHAPVARRRRGLGGGKPVRDAVLVQGDARPGEVAVVADVVNHTAGLAAVRAGRERLGSEEGQKVGMSSSALTPFRTVKPSRSPLLFGSSHFPTVKPGFVLDGCKITRSPLFIAFLHGLTVWKPLPALNSDQRLP